MSKITLDDAKKLAKLSRLEFTDDALNEFVNEFEKTLEQVDAINKIDTSGIDLYEEALLADSQLRIDEIKPSFSQDEIIANAPESKDGAFVVPTTVE
ncbi:MAG: Asp-tRNA(Asn)/Glu-tRNA(Gln) amidotransferase subunit GatC [Clostridia bacterium]|nr:Asp-tRNA(Asn)/Glu-tRNA(Gln) amidotransferase subunit GatC [Clostridia bacterium]